MIIMNKFFDKNISRNCSSNKRKDARTEEGNVYLLRK